MPGPLSPQGFPRRHLLGLGAAALAATQVCAQTAALPAVTGFAKPPTAKPALLAPIKQVRAGLLDVGYAEWGPDEGPTVLLLHGWPYDIHSFDEAAPRLATAGLRVVAPFVRGYGSTTFLSDDTLRTGQPGALALDALSLMDALSLRKPILAGFDWGARTAAIVAALWPERVAGLVSVSGYLIGSQEAGRKPLLPQAELQWWYQFYFATDRGREGYSRHRREFAELIWRLASPKWNFDAATFDRTAAALNNPDHVDIVVHNYRWRLGLALGDPKLEDLESKLAAAPLIGVPAITLEGDANGAPDPEPSAYARKFCGRYEHRLVSGGVGHNLPQEAPQAFAQAVIDLHGR